MGKSSSKSSAHGIEWEGNIKYYQYGYQQPSHEQLMKQMSEGHITHVRLYKIALSNLMWFADPLFFHAFVTFRTVDQGGEWWWSIEKNQVSLVLQRSKIDSDVRDYLQGRKRRSFVNPKILLENKIRGNMKFELLHSYIIITDQLKVGYKFANLNCKGFAKKVFDFMAEPNCWDYDPNNDFKMFSSLLVFASLPVAAIFLRKLRR